MSIIRFEGKYIPTCDYCGKELPGECTFKGAFEAMKDSCWRAMDIDDEWRNFCYPCYKKRRKEERDDNRM